MKVTKKRAGRKRFSGERPLRSSFRFQSVSCAQGVCLSATAQPSLSYQDKHTPCCQFTENNCYCLLFEPHLYDYNRCETKAIEKR